MKNCIGWQRARSENQIEQRTDAILEAAANLLSRYRLDEITLAMIGKEAKFTRSNLYRYFSTKEEIFLQLLSHDMKQWREQGVEWIESGKINQTNFAEAWVGLLLNYDRLLTLFGLLYTLLEKNVSDERFKAFKLATDADIRAITGSLKAKHLFRDEEKAHKFLVTQTSLMSGMYAMVTMTERQRQIMDELDLSFSAQDAQQTLVEGVQALYQSFSG